MHTTFVEGSAGVRMETSTSGRRIEALAVVASDVAQSSVDAGLSAAQWVRASYVVDASYEGEVLMAANCSYSFGREAASK